MEHQEQTPHDLAALYARIIVGWHATVGSQAWRKQFGEDWQRRLGDEFGDQLHDSFERYRHLVARFHDSDLSDPAVQLALANEQISGSMEWAFPMRVEQAPGIDPESRHLGAIARRLRELASPPERPTDGQRTVVRFSDHEHLLAQAREVYGPVVGEDVQGAGGVSFLVSCSLERAERHGEGELTLLSPEVLGVSIAPRGREGDLLEQLGSEGLEILDVTGS